MADQTISVSPSGEEFTLPIEADYQAENDRLAASRILVLRASYREDVGNPAVIIDCFAMLSDTQIKTFFAAGYEVKGLGRGHMNRLKEEVSEE